MSCPVYPLAHHHPHAKKLSQNNCLEHSEHLYTRVPPPPADLSPESAFIELCGTTSRYTPCGPPATTSPYVKELVSWPPPGTLAAPLVQSLDGADLQCIENWSSQILLNAEDRLEYLNSLKRPKVFFEPTLGRRPKVYADFLCHLNAAGMLGWQLSGESLLGVFFVKNKNNRLRLILDTRDVNGFFRPP